MSASESASGAFSDLAMELSACCLDAIECDRLDEIPNDRLGQMFASIVRVYAAKAQKGETVTPFGRNSGVTATDVAIGCTAMMDGVGLALFELGAWQTMTNVRPRASNV
jgi:hypothetical protein